MPKCEYFREGPLESEGGRVAILLKHCDVRLFVAISVPDDVRSAIHRALTETRRQAEGVRWVHPELFHLTLAFLGEIPPLRLGTLTMALDQVQHSAVTVRLGEAGAFPSVRRPKVLWYSLEGELSALHASLGAELADAGFPTEQRPFSAHLTVGRLRQPRAVEAWPPPPVQAEWEVSELVLMQSHLQPGQRPRYEVIHARALASGPCSHTP